MGQTWMFRAVLEHEAVFFEEMATESIRGRKSLYFRRLSRSRVFCCQPWIAVFADNFRFSAILAAKDLGSQVRLSFESLSRRWLFA